MDETHLKTISSYKSYVSKPEITNLDPRFLVRGSKNVLIDYANRVISRNGYILYGTVNTGAGKIVSSYEWDTSTAKQFPLRTYDGRLEFYWNATWNLLKSGYASSSMEFAKVWDDTEKIDVLLYVINDTNQYKWSGGVTKVASSTINTLTKQGVLSSKTTIAFVAGTPYTVQATITDSANGFITAGFIAGDTLFVTGSTANSRNFTIASVTAGVITLVMGDILTSEVAGPTVTVHNGEPTWAISRFIRNTTRAILYNGVSYTYTGGETTDTLTGLTAFPAVTIGDPVWQAVIVLTNGVGMGAKLIGRPTITIASPAVFTLVGHGLVLNDVIFLTPNTTGNPPVTSALPSGLSASVGYYIIAAGLTADTFEISATLGGSAINTSGSQSGTFNLYKSQPLAFTSDLIGVQLNQVILASTKSREVYISSTNDYTNFILTSPRAPTDPAKVTMDDYATCIVPLNNQAQTTSSIAFGAGANEFFQLTFQLSQDNSNEIVRMIKFKTAAGSGLISNGAITSIKNSVAYISREPALDILSNVQNADKHDLPISDPIKDDFDNYDFTNAHVRYWKRALYIAVPASGVVLIYDLMRSLWQPPQYIPVSRLAIIGDWLYGHSSISNETYKLFTGTNDNGNLIPQVARFAYNNGGNRDLLKNMSQYWSDGYITPNGLLTMKQYLGFDGIKGIKVMSIMGSDSSITNQQDVSPLGSNQMGVLDGLPLSVNPTLKGMVRFWQDDSMDVVDYTEEFAEYSMNTLDGRFALVAHGNNQWGAGTSLGSHKK
jgi:hypothetical protein